MDNLKFLDARKKIEGGETAQDEYQGNEHPLR
jgi:hypothetical protein